MIKLKWLISILLCLIVLCAIIELGRAIQEEKYRCQTLTNKMQDLAEDALFYVKPVAGDWKKFDDLDWAFMPDPKKSWVYWRNQQNQREFFTLIDLGLYQDANRVYIKPFQYREGYNFEPILLPRYREKKDVVQIAEGKIWIKTQEPGRLVFAAITEPLKFRSPCKLRLEIRNDYLIQRIKESQAFCWEPVGKFSIETYKENNGREG